MFALIQQCFVSMCFMFQHRLLDAESHCAHVLMRQSFSALRCNVTIMQVRRENIASADQFFRSLNCNILYLYISIKPWIAASNLIMSTTLAENWTNQQSILLARSRPCSTVRTSKCYSYQLLQLLVCFKIVIADFYLFVVNWLFIFSLRLSFVYQFSD